METKKLAAFSFITNNPSKLKNRFYWILLHKKTSFKKGFKRGLILIPIMFSI